MFNTLLVEMSGIDLPANASTSPDGEKETVCTQPPAGLENSPQTVPNGSFSPQNEGAGLGDDLKFTTPSGTKIKRLLLVRVLNICREHTSFHIRTSRGQQDVVRVPIDRKDGGPDWFLEELRDPPVTLLIKGTDRNSPDNNRRTSFRIAQTNRVVSHT